MPTRKQRRRRQKDRRHEYEFVYVDHEGQELEVESEDAEGDGKRRNGKREPKKQPAQKRGNSRPVREIKPPSWNKVAKRALIFFPLIFLAFSFLNSGQAIGTRLAISLLYTGFFVPFMYLMDRAMYRSYLKRTGRPLPERQTRRR
jgi:hypothetical protein